MQLETLIILHFDLKSLNAKMSWTEYEAKHEKFFWIVRERDAYCTKAVLCACVWVEKVRRQMQGMR